MGFTIRMKIDNGEEKKYKLQTVEQTEESEEEEQGNGSDDQDAN